MAVFFETEEPTGLHFQVHGPFQLTDNRANIKRDDPWNTLLIGEVSTLLAESLPVLRDGGLIKRSFLEVMPNASDDLPEPWQPLLAAVVKTFQEQALLPAFTGGQACSCRLWHDVAAVIKSHRNFHRIASSVVLTMNEAAKHDETIGLYGFRTQGRTQDP
ncbi:hypothetical protein FJ976_20075 [Mesorhizobium sp. B1-1-9]|uniref:hypothetical protein n=1 Tax=Mesorhizobium sp. B1-1-9 TaxID=2589975 RepID=UPI00112B4E22|nr:hypothetical protein [Mesorhizobium sp. B1-1-9]TPN47937.1 hypothetical protein FJ976_20075 [Mesorhizobium sp. B1-1-9]